MLAMCLFSGQGYEEVARLLTQGLERVRRWEKPWRVPTTAAIGRARRRLGPEPLKVLFERVCRPVAAPDTAGAWYRRWRLVAVDGTVFDVPDTGANSGFFEQARLGPRTAAQCLPAGESCCAGGVRDTRGVRRGDRPAVGS